MTTKIRFAEPEDAAGVLAIYAPFCDASFVSFEDIAPTMAQMQERMAKISTQYPWLVCDIDGEVAGYVYASRHRERAAYRWAVDVAVYVGAAYRRRRVGQALYTSLFGILREQGYVNAYAGITLPNPASVGLHEAVGFRPLGVFPSVGFKVGQWRDVGWWWLGLMPAKKVPEEPRPIGHIQDGDAVAAALIEAERLIHVGKKH
jgi:L-amino acid N-acyltransferase YncA